MNQKLDIELPEETVQLIDQLAQANSLENKRQKRSNLIAQAVEFYAAETRKAELKQQLQEGAIHRSQRDLHLAEEWFSLDEEAWHNKDL